jgi:hypothetical protein
MDRPDDVVGCEKMRLSGWTAPAQHEVVPDATNSREGVSAPACDLWRKRFRRILFLVDRNALGRQTLDAMSTTDTSGFLKFDQIFPVADLAKKFPEATDRVQMATVQAMIHAFSRILILSGQRPALTISS